MKEEHYFISLRMSNPVSDVVQDSKRRRKEFGLRDLSAMKITSLVGDGTYGMVFRAKDKVTGMSVALKKIKMEQETQGFPVTVRCC